MSECLMDFPHNYLWCQACYDSEMQRQLAEEARRANDLYAHALDMQENRTWVQPAPKVQTRYIQIPSPPPQIKNTGKEGEPKDERNLFG
jgi:hypothetical protein